MGDDFLDGLIQDKRLVTLLVNTGTLQGSETIFEVIEGVVTSYSGIGLGFTDVNGVRLWLPIPYISKIIEKDNNSEQPIVT
jgi:hypothetical protein